MISAGLHAGVQLGPERRLGLSQARRLHLQRRPLLTGLGVAAQRVANGIEQGQRALRRGQCTGRGSKIGGVLHARESRRGKRWGAAQGSRGRIGQGLRTGTVHPQEQHGCAARKKA